MDLFSIIYFNVLWVNVVDNKMTEREFEPCEKCDRPKRKSRKCPCEDEVFNKEEMGDE